MKNLINYYYGLICENIIRTDELYKFSINNNNYIFLQYNEDINRVIELYNYVRNSGIYCDEIIYNKDNSPITLYENKSYILIKKTNMIDNEIDLNYILTYSIPVYIKKDFNWQELWSKKIDYYEYQLNQFGKKHPMIRESFGYYNGMMETAISLLNFVNKKNLNFYLSHSRIKLKDNMSEFLNPLNFIVDVKIRDVCEYFKEKFFLQQLNFQEVQTYIYNMRLNNDEALLFLARMIMPSYYCDIYDDIIREKEVEESVIKYIDNINNYEQFLYNLYYFLNSIYKIPEIEWIKKI